MANWTAKIVYTHPSAGSTTITFALPPEGDPFQLKKVAVLKQNESSSGKLQSKHNFNRNTVKIKLVFLTKTILDLLETLFDDHASLGKTFDYYPSTDVGTFHTVTWAKPTWAPKRTVRSGADFIYDMTIDMREEI